MKKNTLQDSRISNATLQPLHTLWAVLSILVCSFTMFSQTTHNINDPESLTALSSTLAAGDTVILADGTYTSDARIKFSPTTGTAAMPIIFRPQTPGGVKFTGGLKMSIGGDYVIVDGFHWLGGYGASNFIEFRDGSDYANYSTIQNCAIDGLQVDPDDLEPGTSVKHRWIVLYGTYNTVINCSFMNKTNAGALILVELEYNASPDDGVTNTRCNVVGHTISNNYFYKYAKIDPALTNAGDSETIRVGTSEYQNVDSSTTISNNYFVEADGENEIITNKSKNNTYINNTFRRCRGSLVLRHGSHATVDGNYFLGEDVDGTGGIRIVDSNHIITNNYIQDCITVGDNAIWNNGITFLGGSANNAVICTSTSVSNSYQKALNITLSNNSIVNTNAPLFFNVNTGTNDVTGTVSNNLIYFAAADPNLSNVISGNTASAYTDFGTALTYTGNDYKGATLGVTNTGFTENTGITASPNGEIFTFSGATGKGADMGVYAPITDETVGYGIGACFLNYLGVNITDGNCIIEIPESLTVSSLSTLAPSAASYDVSVYANVSWTALSNDAWISIDTNSGTGNATVSVTVTENVNPSSRTGTVTFTQDPGGDDIVRTLNVTQEAADPRTGLNLINVLSTDFYINYFSHEENVPPNKINLAPHSLDKNFNSYWAGDRTQHESGRAIIIYDLKGTFDLDLVDIATTGGKTYQLQIWVSSTGTDDIDFSNPFPPGDLISNTDASFKAFILPTTAVGTKYVKIIGNGQPNGSNFTSIHEIEFYGNSSLSIDDNDLANAIKMYPNPVKDILTLKNIGNNVNLLQVFSIDGRKVYEKTVNSSGSEIKLDMSPFANGTYILNVLDSSQTKQVKMIIVSH